MSKYIKCLLFLLICVFLVGCQPTPEKTVVIGKNNLEQLIKQTPMPTQSIQTDKAQKPPAETVIEKEKWQDSFDYENNSVKVIIDAAIEKPMVTVYPVVKVTPHRFTQEEAQRAVDVLLENKPLYEYDGYTKTQIENIIIKIEARIENIRQEPNIEEEERNELTNMLTNELNNYQKMYNEADDIEIKPATMEFKKDETSGYNKLSVKADLGKATAALLKITLSDDNLLNEIIFLNSDYFIPFYPVCDATDILTGVKITKQQALEMAEKLLQEMGINNMQLEASRAAVDINGLKPDDMPKAVLDNNRMKCFDFNFSPIIGNIPTTITEPCYGIESNSGDIDEYEAVWNPEEIEIKVDDSGVFDFSWSFPGDILEVLNDNVQLKNFDEIKDIFKKQIFYQRSWVFPGAKNNVITIKKIILGMMRVKIKDNSYIILPVWDFIGDWTYNLHSQNYNNNDVSFLTLNAVDGSVINRYQG